MYTCFGLRKGGFCLGLLSREAGYQLSEYEPGERVSARLRGYVRQWVRGARQPCRQWRGPGSRVAVSTISHCAY
jgi:hypothetical protein